MVLTHAPMDYMEDHVNTCRLAVTGAFARGMPSYRTIPAREAVRGETVTVYRDAAQLCDPLGQPVTASLWVNTAEVQDAKREALAEHRSQRAWLDTSQGMDSYLVAMDDFARRVGRQSGKFSLAEGWRRHTHLGFCAADADPLLAAVGAMGTWGRV